jgi:hypothetical protein
MVPTGGILLGWSSASTGAATTDSLGYDLEQPVRAARSLGCARRLPTIAAIRAAAEFASSCSQKRRTVQPACFSSSFVSVSRSRLREIFEPQ